MSIIGDDIGKQGSQRPGRDRSIFHATNVNRISHVKHSDAKGRKSIQADQAEAGLSAGDEIGCRAARLNGEAWRKIEASQE